VTDHLFLVRVLRTDTQSVRAYARSQVFDVGSQASLRESDAHPSAVEYLLGALGGDLVDGFAREAGARGVELRAIEVALSGRLENILVHLGVRGEYGHAGFAAIDGTIYVDTDAEPRELDAAWQAALGRSPLFNTLSRCAAVAIDLRVMR
jgi:hypothetical protein